MTPKKMIICLVVLVLLFLPSSGLAQGRSVQEKEIKINIPSFSLALIEKGKVLKTYKIAVGKPTAPTPLGNFAVINKVVNPTWYPPTGGKPVPTGPKNPLGYRWIGFRSDGYGIHGTNNPDSISKAVSLGCIRMNNSDVEELFSIVNRNIPVKIVYETIEIEELDYGQVKLTVYKDIYGKGINSPDNVKKALEQSGYGDRFGVEELESLISKSKSGSASVVKGLNLYQDNKVIAENCLKNREDILIPVEQVERLAEKSVYYDENSKQWFLSGVVFQPIVIGDRYYVSGIDLEERLGIVISNYGEIERREVLGAGVYSSKGQKINDFFYKEEGIFISIDELAPLLPLGIVYYPDRGTVKLKENVEIEYTVIDQTRCLEMKEINRVLKTDFVYKDGQIADEVDGLSDNLIP